MNEVKLVDISDVNKAFIIEQNGNKVAEMVVGIKDNIMSVYHTEVNRELEGKGVAKELLNEMTAHAKLHNLKVLPICTYVNAVFRKDPEKYNAIWKRNV